MLYTHAHIIAITVLETLRPHCDTINIAGSVRRQKYEVKDIEICCVPKTVSYDLFGSIQERSPAFVEAVNSLGHIVSGKPKEGRWVKVELPTGINLDLFIPQPHDYYRIYAIRTGSREYSHHVIATAWERKGWCGTKDGLRLQAECYQKEKVWICNAQNPTLPPVWKSEAEFFTWLNIEHVKPMVREVTAAAYNQYLKQ